MRPRRQLCLALAGLAATACGPGAETPRTVRPGERFTLVAVNAAPLPVLTSLPAMFGNGQWEYRVLADTLAVTADRAVRRVRWLRPVPLEAWPCAALRGLAEPGSGGLTWAPTPLPPAVRDTSCDALRTGPDTTMGQLRDQAGVQAIVFTDPQGRPVEATLTWRGDTLLLSLVGDPSVFAYQRIAPGRAG